MDTKKRGLVGNFKNSGRAWERSPQAFSLVIAATNHFESLDPALFRRFNDVLHYDLPDEGSDRNAAADAFGPDRG